MADVRTQPSFSLKIPVWGLNVPDASELLYSHGTKKGLAGAGRGSWGGAKSYSQLSKRKTDKSKHKRNLAERCNAIFKLENPYLY